MKFPIVIPQLFYDLIARILPGFYFLALVQISLPRLARYLYPQLLTGRDSFVDSLGLLAGYAIICYFLGWLFLAFVWDSKQEEICEKHGGSKSKNKEYQWIRLSHPAAGFRIIKLRAEARMLETTRTSMPVIIVLAIVYLCIVVILLISESNSIDKFLWMRPLTGVLISTVSFYGFRRRERIAWKNYYGNINIIYDILHDTDDPVKLSGENKDKT